MKSCELKHLTSSITRKKTGVIAETQATGENLGDKDRSETDMRD